MDRLRNWVVGLLAILVVLVLLGEFWHQLGKVVTIIFGFLGLAQLDIWER